jgi:hypothetical protein
MRENIGLITFQNMSLKRGVEADQLTSLDMYSITSFVAVCKCDCFSKLSPVTVPLPIPWMTDH